MKKTIADGICAFVLFMVFILAFGLCGKAEHTYRREATIISIDNNIVTAKDISGYSWQFKADAENDFYNTEKVFLIMDDNLTDYIEDDIVKNVKINKKGLTD